MSEECGEILGELHTFLDGEVGPEFAAAITDHLTECPPCEDRAVFERRVREVVATKCTDCAPADLRERIILQLFRP